MSTKETTNAQYVAFLNAVGASNTNGVYNGSMGSVASGGIVQAGSPGSYTYSVKPGTAPSGASYASMPVNFVNWFSAARFVNWMANGQLTGTTGIASMEVGSYTLLNATSGNIIPRNVGATVFLPSADEWYKAAFYNGSAYTTWQTNSNTTPTATLTFSTANAANVASVTTSPVAVGSYTNSSVSAYGMYDMLGNVTEITDTAMPPLKKTPTGPRLHDADGLPR
jgi:formylglycine-generating enzyme required for sulfatase activity